MNDSVRTKRSPLGAPVGMLLSSLSILTERGFDTIEILRKCAIPRSLLTDGNNRVTTDQFNDFVLYLLEHTKIPGLGLLMGSTEKLGDVGFAGYALLSCENLDMARRIMDRYTPFAGPNYNYLSELVGDEVAVVHHGLDSPLPLEWYIEDALAAVATMMRQVLPDHAKFTSVHLTYPAPEHAAMYDELFECPVHFESQRNELRYPRSLLTIPFKNPNALLREFCLRECGKVLDDFKPRNTLADEIETLLRSSSGTIPPLPEVASALNISPRTLSRRLMKEGTSYRQIVENLRKRLALEYLSTSRLQQKEIAYLLGYAETANFYHAFQRWFGCTPSEYVERNLKEGA